MAIQTYYIGCSGWRYREWRNHFYQGIPQRLWFEYYAINFNTVEINNTFYRWPNATLIKKWYEQSPPTFIYTFKAHRKFSSFKQPEPLQMALQDFYHTCQQVHEKLGYILFQLPARLIYEKNLLNNLIRVLNPQFKNAVEFRHPSWWHDDVYQALAEHNIAFCNVSAAGLPETLKITNGEIYLRFHGKKTDHHYSEQELMYWAKAVHQSSAQQVWCYFNNIAQGHALNNAITFYRLLTDTPLTELKEYLHRNRLYPDARK